MKNLAKSRQTMGKINPDAIIELNARMAAEAWLTESAVLEQSSELLRSFSMLVMRRL